jgi:hypothetical protein
LATSVCAVFLHAAPAGAEIWVANGGSAYRISVFDDGANGNTPPLRTIEGSNTRLAVPDLIAVDRVHGEIFVANDFSNEIDVFPIGASGNVAPSRILSGPATGLSGTDAVVIDLAHDEILVACYNDYANGSVSAFPRTANGNVAPLRKIQGAKTGLTYLSGLAVDPVAGEIFITSQGGNSPSGVRVFPRTANGNVAPVRTIAGDATGMSDPYGIVLNAVDDEILLADRAGGIRTFPRTANGNVAPVRAIVGAATGLGQDIGISQLGATEIVVANQGEHTGKPTDDALLVFPLNANGNVAPTRILAGAATKLTDPDGLVVAEPTTTLLGGRFAVEAEWKTPQGAVGSGEPVAITSDTGYFWFFAAANVESVVKVLDGCALNGHFWVFGAGLTNVLTSLKITDLATGATRSYVNPQNTTFLPIQDTSAFATCSAKTAAPIRQAATGDATSDVLADADGLAPPTSIAGAAGIAGAAAVAGNPTAATSTTVATPTSIAAPATPSACSGLCLGSTRFQVAATWRTPDGASGSATGVALTTDTGYLWFFSAANVEAIVKIVDGCGLNQHYWIFAGGLTDVRVNLTVEDTVAGITRTYSNPQGQAFQPIQDTSAFATCP